MMAAQVRRLLADGLLSLFRIRLGWEVALFVGLALVALGLRIWELDARTMHYDESLHVHYAWRLAVGDGYSHSPWMHGPFQVHLTALIFKLFSDSDFTARLGYALFGAALVAMPYFLRTYLGRTGAVVTSVLLVLSPSLLYFSRFGRNEILMAFLAVALLILMWRYLNEGKNRYLYMASAVLALAFATKETSYIIVAIFGAALLLMSLTEIIPWMLGRIKLSEMRGAPAFLILLVTLTLPQWAALVSIFQDGLGVMLANSDGGTGEVGMPVLGAPFISFPIVSLPLAFNVLITVAILAVPLGVFLFSVAPPFPHPTSLAHFRWRWMIGLRISQRWAKRLLAVAVLAALAYAFISFPNGSVPRDYLISFGILFAALMLSAVIGLMWRWRVWLVCAAIFYTIWTMLYTSVFGLFVQPHGYCPSEVGSFFGTLCSKLGGVYTGSWQGLGYWLAQQDVARGGQPWYYHFVIGSVYEFLPLIFGVIAIVYFLKKGELFGLMLAFWAVLTLLAYTVAAEKMPWLLVNMALPFIFLTGKFIGDIIDRVRWRRVLRRAPIVLLVLAPLLLLAGVALLQRYLERGKIDSWQTWGLLSAVIVIGVASAYLVVRARPRLRMTLAGLGVGVLLLGFSTFVAFRASYNYDDSPIEMLVYAQGSTDISKIVKTLDNGVLGEADGQQAVDVDYELWYPFNWYVRHEQKGGTLGFKCYKNESEDGYVSWCNPLEEPPSAKALLLIEPHANRDSAHLSGFEKSGPFRNLLWFPESYRRLGEDRRSEGMGEELKEDFHFVKDNITRREPWKNALDYFLFRRLGNEWWNSTFFAYTSEETPS